jgi:hypothetical protein
LDVPYSRSYWVIPGRFLAGGCPGSKHQEETGQKPGARLACGICHYINSTEPDKKDWRGKPFFPDENQLKSISASMGP